jgi:hypothetical protein
MPSTWFLDTPPAGQLPDAGAVAHLLYAGSGQAPALNMLDFINQSRSR